MEWVVMNGLSFSFVENEYNKKYTSLNPISRPTLMKYLELVKEKVEQKITVLLPEKYGIIIDGWSASSTSEDYLALYATYPSSSNERLFSQAKRFPTDSRKKCFPRTLKCKCSSLQTNLFGMLNLLNQQLLMYNVLDMRLSYP